MRKRTLLLPLIAALCLTGCSHGSENGITLSIMGKQSDLNKSYMTSIFQQYEKETGNKLQIIAYEDREYESIASEKFEAGDVPDVFLHFNNADLHRFDVDANFCYLNDQSWVSDLTESAKAYCTDADGNLLGLPFWESSVSGCYYNKTILNELGMKPATTQAEFDTICQVLADTGYTPICWPANGCAWMLQFGMDPIFADDPAVLEQINRNEISYAAIPEMHNMVQWISDAAEKGWFGSDFLNIGWDELGPTMASGDAVMTFIWDTWFYTDLPEDGTYTVDDFALMPVFMNTADSGTYEGGNLNMMMVSKNSSNKDAALEFLAFCADPEHYNKAFDGIATVSCFNGQTTNIQSQMVTDAESSIAANERVSTASSRIIGYSGDDVMLALNNMFKGNTDVTGCVEMMDNFRIEEAVKQGVEGF